MDERRQCLTQARLPGFDLFICEPVNNGNKTPRSRAGLLMRICSGVADILPNTISSTHAKLPFAGATSGMMIFRPGSP